MLFITQPRVGRSHNEILALQICAKELGWNVISADGSWRLTNDIINSKSPGVPYGSQLFCEAIAQQMNWKLKMNSFDWLTKVPKKYLKRQVDFMTLKDAKLIDVRKFIKPADDKCFDAKIYEPGEFKPSEFISEDYPVLVSDIVEFTHEYRCFIINNKCVTSSCYIYDGEIAEPKDYNKFTSGAEKFVNMIIPKINSKIKSECAVVDVGLVKNCTWAVVESNPAWASGLYGCDPYQALLTMKSAVQNGK